VRIFLTGGTGFIGGETARQLRQRGDEVVALVRNPQKGAKLSELGCELVSGDLGDEAALRKGMEGCDAVIHAAAIYEVGIPAKQRPVMWEANVAGTERVMKAALEAQVPRIVYVSTVGIFGNTHKQVVDETYKNPETDFTSYYEETKLEAHKVVQRMIDEQDLPAVIVQPGGVYGPGDTSQVADLLEQFFAGKLPLMPFPELGICMTHVEDIAGGILLGLDKGRLGEAYVISGPVTTMREAVEMVAKVSGRKAPKRNLPTGLMKMMIPLGPVVGKVMGQPPNLRELITSGDNVTFWASYDKAQKELGYSPRGMEEGLRQTLEADDRFPSPAD
jgi:nucleoside-diphosphate-sugar epimerase